MTWSAETNIKGPQGSTGPPGADGADGAPGVQGPEGPQGPVGPEGPEGPEGPQGPQGPVGPAGSSAWADITGKPTTIAGYGITDAYTKAQVDASLALKVNKAGDTMTGNLSIQNSAAASSIFSLTGPAGGAFHADFVMRHLGTGQNRIISKDAAGNDLWLHYLGLSDGDWLLQRVSGGTFNAVQISRTTGVMTLEAIPVLPAADPTTANQAARKAYVDAKLGSITETLITAAGTTTYTKPAGLKYLEVEIQAPGGGGGSCQTTSTGQQAAGGGGGAGSRGYSFLAAAAVAASVTVTLGSPGAASGGAGGTSSFGSLSAGGGLGGSTGLVNGIGGGGGGGVATGFQVNAPGEGGDTGWCPNTTFTLPGHGGSSPCGGSHGALLRGGSGVGVDGTGFGCGGSGGYNAASQTAKAGGAGAPGFIRLREYF